MHPNTIAPAAQENAELSGLDLRKDDWLMIEIAVKMVKLEQALGTKGKTQHIAAAQVWRNRTFIAGERGCYPYFSTSQEGSSMSGEAISADAVWQDMQARGVEFVFAQFVD